MVAIISCTTTTQANDLRVMLKEYLAWAKTFVKHDLEEAPTFNNLDDEFATLPGIFAPEHGGIFFLAYDGDDLAGCVALKKVDDTTGELKRMYVRPQYRGQKIGWQLANQLVEQARTFGYDKIVLDSHHTMTKAHSIYRAIGFVDVPIPDDFPEHLKPIVVFMEMQLEE